MWGMMSLAEVAKLELSGTSLCTEREAGVEDADAHGGREGRSGRAGDGQQVTWGFSTNSTTRLSPSTPMTRNSRRLRGTPMQPTVMSAHWVAWQASLRP